ncbi:hypothetical protein APHAL10511_005627 [Amanita phalloides]|nr:hypothetical protein APHAL10511_005627 [Amanita phalloides]
MLKDGPNESVDYVLMERTFIASYFIVGVGYGVQLVLYTTCASYLWRQRKSRGKVAFSRLAYITVLILFESWFVASTNWIIEDMYITNRNYPGGPLAYFYATQYLPEDVTFITSLFILNFLSDLLVFWRCWIIWSTVGRFASYAVLSTPTLALVSSFVLGIIWILKSSQRGVSMYSKVPVAFGTAYYVVSFSVNVLVTAFIILRLLLHRRAVLNILPEEYTKHYLSTATIVIESALLYSIFALVFIVTYAIDNPVNTVFMCVASSCQQIAGYLIILRVAQGRAWTSDTLAKGIISGSGHTSRILFNPPVASVHQGDIESQDICAPESKGLSR